ncbi:hypothetical protein SRHO_G00294010 [Serrasalmus rhombeus]
MTFVINQGMAMYWGDVSLERYGDHVLSAPYLPVRGQLSCGYQWLKERVYSEEGRRQLAKIKELHLLADRLGCTAAQLAIAWCLRSEGVSSVLLGVSNTDQLLENLGALRVLSQMTPQTVSEMDALLGNKPHSKKESRA